MDSSRKTALVAGLGKFAPADAGAAAAGRNPDQIREAVKASVERARQAGFDCTAVDVDPQNPKDSIGMLKEHLGSQHYDAFIIGYGVRAIKDLTSLFEDAVNASREVSPSTKLGFSTGPEAIFETLQRLFPGTE